MKPAEGSAGASSPPAAPPKAPTPKQQLLALLNERFPALAKIAPDSPPDVVSAAAKRWTAILLAEGPHPHEKDAAALEQSLRQLISAPLPLGLGELVREDEAGRATFEVTGEQGGGNVVVGLACPQLLALAQAMAAPRPAAASPVAASTSAAAATGTGATILEEPAAAASPELPDGSRPEAGGTLAGVDRAWGASTTAAAPTPSPRQLLWEPINARFPPVTRVNPDSPPEVVAAAAKRRMVMLLAEVGPPHEVPEVAIVSQLSRRLGGAVLPRSVRALASEAPGTFAVETRADGQLWLRLVDPEFLELASAYAPQGSADASYAPAGSAGVAGRAHGSGGPNAGSGTDFKAQVWTILNRRFLPNMKLLPDATPDAVAAAAKRWMAMLLFESTQAPPYHALPASVLQHRLVNCLHGWALPAPAWVLASSQPETFIVSGMMNGDALITLACPLLLDIARRRANSAAYEPAAVEHWSAGRPAGGHPQAHATSAPAAPPAEVQPLRYQPGAAAAKGPRVPEVAKAGATRGPGPARASGAAASGSNGTHSPIETALDELFGPRVKVAADGPHDVVASVAKRWMALVLTEQLPPHELREVALARVVSHRLGGTRALPRSVAALAAEDPATFRLALQAKGEWAVRLVCPRLLELAAGAWAEHASLIPAAALAGGPEASATGLAESSGSSSSNGGSGAAGMSPGHKKLMWRELNGRFPPVAELSARSPPEAVAAGAKRRLAALLAEAPAPHELSVAELERALPPLLGGAALTTTVAALATEGEAARGAFRLAKLPGGDVVRLVCPALLRLAEGLGPEDAAGPAAGGSSSAVAGATLNGGSTAAAGWSIPMPIPVPVPVPVPEPGSRADAWAAALASLTLESAPLQAEASSLPYAAVQHVSDPWSAEFAAMLQHCQACAQIGLAVQPPYGRPELVSLYVPPTADGAAAAAVYLLDCASCEQLYGGGEAGLAVRSALAGGIRQVLENEAVAKVVHGARQVAFLEAFCGGGARASPLLDTRVVVAGMGSMLGLRPPPSLAAAPSPAALLTALAAHVQELRAALAATGLWADRPELLAAVAGAHGAALRDEAAAAAGAAAAVPEALQQQEAVAMSRHLPELWAALAEGWWWVAVGAVEGSIGKNRAEAEAAARAWGVGF